MSNLTEGFDPLSTKGEPNLEFEYREYLRYTDAAMTATGDPALGLKFGADFGIRDYGILGYAMLSCRDLRQCLDSFQGLNDLFGDVAELERDLHTSGKEIIYRCISHLPDQRQRRFEVQTAFAQFMQLRSLLAKPESFKPVRVEFDFSRPDDTNAYDNLFGQNVCFDAACSELAISTELLDEPFALHNEEARVVCERECELLFREMHSVGALIEKVRQIAMRNPGDIPDLDSMAKQLLLSPRTLRRRLADEGSSYHEIVAEVREHLARRYLAETNLAIKEVAYLLGYSEVANFQRAFKKRIGQTPGNFRASQGSN